MVPQQQVWVIENNIIPIGKETDNFDLYIKNLIHKNIKMYIFIEYQVML